MQDKASGNMMQYESSLLEPSNGQKMQHAKVS